MDIDQPTLEDYFKESKKHPSVIAVVIILLIILFIIWIIRRF